jgi:hypothetical protein
MPLPCPAPLLCRRVLLDRRVRQRGEVDQPAQTIWRHARQLAELAGAVQDAAYEALSALYEGDRSTRVVGVP